MSPIRLLLLLLARFFRLIGTPIFILLYASLVRLSTLMRYVWLHTHHSITVFDAHRRRAQRTAPLSFQWHRKQKRRGRKKKHLISTTVEPILPPIVMRIVTLCFTVEQWFVRHAAFLIITTGLFATIGAVAYTSYVLIFKDLPDPSTLRTHRPIVSTKIYDRHHVLLYTIFKDENRSLTTLEKLPQHLVDATISIEDKEFYSHHGISLRGIGRVLNLFAKEGKVQGASTITQQLIKNTLLTSERTLPRKLKEIVLALRVEQMMSKEEILQMYFNEVSYGGPVYGIQEAAHTYFGVDAGSLTLAQSAYLAGLPAAPSAYSAYGTRADLGIARQHEVLRRMVEDGKVSALDAELAKSEKLTFAPARSDIKAPHFVMYIRDLLSKTYGDDVVLQGGLEVITSLDLTLQDQVQQIVTNEVKKLSPLRVGNGAALVTNPATGEILAMVGSTDYFATKQDGQVNVTIRPRQPGSSIKPLTYTAAFERGLTPASMIDDSPITYSSPGGPPYSPKNYDGAYHGNVSVRRALANSYNIPAVKTLASIGVETMVTKGRQLGITTWDTPSRFGLSLTLGGGEVLMTDMAVLYGTFANAGQTVALSPILSVRDPAGKELFAHPCPSASTPCQGKRTVDERIAYQITSILSDNIARSDAFGSRSVLLIPDQEVAVKTGTTNGLRDNWTFGYTSDRLVAVWVGNNDNSQMSRVTSGITGASPIWNTIMRTLIPKDTRHVFRIPPDLVTRLSCDGKQKEYFLPGTEPDQRCGEEPKQAITRHIDDQILDGVTTE